MKSKQEWSESKVTAVSPEIMSEVQMSADIIARIDASRETYIQKYEDTSRYDTRNYQLVISMDDLSEDDAVEVILDYINRTSK